MKNPKRGFFLFVLIAILLVGIIPGPGNPFSNPAEESQTSLSQRPLIDPGRIAVAVFENRTGNPELDHLGLIAQHWITLGLQQTGCISVAGQVPDKYSEKGEEDTDFIRWTSQETYAGIVVTGAYCLQGENLQFHAQVHDTVKGKLLHTSEPVSGPIGNPMKAIESLRRQVIEALALIIGSELGGRVSTEPELPSYESYKEFIEGLKLSSSNAPKKAVEHFERSHILDPDFLPPLFWRFFVLANRGEHGEAEPLLKELEQKRDMLPPIFRHLLEYAKALLNGSWLDRCEAIRQAAKLDKDWSYDYGIAALNVNRPREAIAAFKSIDPERGVVRGWTQYWSQLTLACHLAGEHGLELKEARRARRQYPDDLSVLWLEARAQAALGKIREVNDLIAESFRLPPKNDFNPGVIMLNAWMELNHQGYEKASMGMLERSLEWHRKRPEKETETISYRYSLARVFYYSGMWEEAKFLFEGLHRENPENVRYHGWLGSTLASIDDKVGALRISKELEKLDRPNLLGHHTYRRARIAAILGEKETAVRLLREALEQGYFFTKLHPSSDFEKLWDYPPFQELIAPKE